MALLLARRTVRRAWTTTTTTTTTAVRSAPRRSPGLAASGPVNGRRLSGAAAPAASVPPLADLVVTAAAARRIGALQTEDGASTRLRLGVDGGGCSGFQYSFTTEPADDPLANDDAVFERDGRQVVVDETSLDFVRGATIDYQEEMIRSAFVVVNNPNSESACGCGSSFALKNFEANPAVD